MNSADFDVQHALFALSCLAPLRQALAAKGLPLLVRVGEACQLLSELRQTFAFSHLLSHEETGPGWSYDRDRAVAAWCRMHSVAWQEWPQTGVVRRLKSRQGWAARWAARMNAAPARVQGGFNALSALHAAASGALPTLASLGLPSQGRALPAAGEAAAWTILRSFLNGRGRDYRRAVSSPLTAWDGCSRLSPHLSFGTVSLRCVHQATEAAFEAAGHGEAEPAMAYALRGFAGRLRWHCHFMQKLEDEPAIEHHNFARIYDGLRENDFNEDRFAAWCAGRTGFPMVDACMRALCATGWLNFRMRAMLVSFAAYHLWLHWREPGLFLARQFLDFEPGIHWSQMQMQSGTTGINTLRIYSPSKQALDQDPQGLFVRRWVPEWGTDAYPAPIVDERSALKAAKMRLSGLRDTAEAREEAAAIQRQHGSRRSGLPSPPSHKAAQPLPRATKAQRTSAATPPQPVQGDLFGD